MSAQLILWSEPRARRRDPETSRDAARAVRQYSRVLENLILEEFSLHDGMTDEELVARIPDIREDTVKSRRSGLKNRGLLVDSGKKRINSRGRPQIVWEMAHD